MAGRVSLDLAAGRRNGLSRDARALEREPIPPDRKRVQAGQDHRMIRNAFAEELHVRQMARPGALIPSPPSDPFAFWRARGTRNDSLDGLGGRPDADQIDAFEVRAE